MAEAKNQSRLSFGREEILFCVNEANDENIIDLVTEAIGKHTVNNLDIQYLFEYCKGKQAILNRTKTVRPEINNKVVVNRALEIVEFKLGHQVGEPVQYVNRTSVESLNDDMTAFNDTMYLAKKHNKDLTLMLWMLICGVGYRLVLPNKSTLEDESCIEISTLDPRFTFVAKKADKDKTPLFGCTVVSDNDTTKLCVYTSTRYYEIVDKEIVRNEPHLLKRIPIFEYKANEMMLGSFEPVISLLDAINMTYSNAVDAIEQFVQSLLKFVNVDITEEDFETLRELGAIKLRSTSTNPADVSYLNQPLSQEDTLKLTRAMYQDVLTICMMPSRNGNAIGGDTGNAVVMRDGWESANAYAKSIEMYFKDSEMEMLKVALHIARTKLENFNLKLKDIDIKFTRRNYENIVAKVQVLTQMLANDKIHPLLAFTYANMFSDAGAAYAMSQKYADERQAEALKELEEFEADQEAQSKGREIDV